MSYLINVIILVSISLISADAYSMETDTYWNKKNGYGISYPLKWQQSHSDNFLGNDIFSVSNNNSDLSLNVTSQLLTGNRGRYKRITDVPNIAEGLIAELRTSVNLVNVQSGTTSLSNTDAIWIKSTFVHRSLNQEVWFAMYQVTAWRNDMTYTLTVKATSLSQEGAERKFNQNWPFLSSLISSFTFYN